MKIAWARSYMNELPEGHRFPMLKYALIPEQLVYEGIIQPSDLFEPTCLSEEIILLTNTKDYWDKLKFGTIKIGDKKNWISLF